MFDLSKLRSIEVPRTVILGNHQGIIQSILDFDFISGKTLPSISLIIGGTGTSQRFFWGDKQVRIKSIPNLQNYTLEGGNNFDYFISTDSGRRVYTNIQELFKHENHLLAGVIFAEAVPERHAIAIRALALKKNIAIVGPSSVGLLLPGIVKLGAIGGTQPAQIIESGIDKRGSVAVISTSGGMTNEIISFTADRGLRLSFAAAVGGERFPIMKPVDLVRAALEDEYTDSILFFGELGGRDEYEIGDVVKNHPQASKKEFIAYIAGKSAESFEQAPQFGHAKALAGSVSESASSKIEYLVKSGVTAVGTFKKFEEGIEAIAERATIKHSVNDEHAHAMKNRRTPLFTSRISKDSGGDVTLFGERLTDYVEGRSLSEIALSMFLGHQPASDSLVRFFDLTVRLLVDHGPQVSGAVNTMITARAGRDLPSSLAAGLLTIGPRFGGAINSAVTVWLGAVEEKISAEEFVEKFAKNKEYIPGIGHKKYRLDNPDPRVSLLLDTFGDDIGEATRFALSVEKITTAKKSQLILNVDGLVAAMMIDILHDKEEYSYERIRNLIDMEFFNAIFVYARTTGFIAHFLDQKRADDGLFRLPDDYIEFEN